MPRLSLSLLGPKQILLEDKPVRAFTYHKALALLAYLAIEADVPHSRQELVGLLWPDLPHTAALTNLRQVLADLRQAIADETAAPPFLLITRESIQFNVDSDFQLDLTSFLQLLSTCESHRHRHLDRCRICQARLEAAIELYRGDFLSGFSVEGAAPFEDWISLRREQLHSRAQQTLVYLINYQLRCRNDEKVQRYLRRQVELEPWHEEAHLQLMRLYSRNGQRSSALQQFESCQRILRAELGVDPSPLTQTIYAQIRAGLPLAEEANAQQLRYWHNLPLAATSFVGRSQEIAQLGELLADPAHRLITIIGPGGIGKTRLALAAAAEYAVSFGNGVLFVSLAGMSDVNFLPNAIIAALDAPMPDRRTPQAQVLTFLHDLEVLLLLDNYEQFLPDVAFLTQLLHSAPGVTILVTSRERLAMQAEHLFELTGLDSPRGTSPVSVATLDEYSALQLFVQRVRQAQRNFAVTTTDVAAILRIGRMTEGMPLALELAAAAVRSHSCAAIADALESGQQVLSSQMRDLPERQRSMQAVFAHSMRLLSADEYRVFCALSLFRGGFTAEAAQKVADAPQPVLGALVDKSLLRVSLTYRYDIHELMRQFAEKELAASGVAVQVRERYVSYFRKLAQAANEGLVGTRPGIWIARLEAEIDNLRTVLHWLRNVAGVDALHMAVDLYWFWQSNSHLEEGLNWYIGLSSSDVAVEPLFRARVYRDACFLALCLNRVEQADDLIVQSLALYEKLDLAEPQNVEGYSSSLQRLAYVHLFQGGYEQAIVVSYKAQEVAQSIGSKFQLSYTLYAVGEALCMLEQYDLAQQSYAESHRIRLERGDARAIGRTTGRLASVTLAQGELGQARLLCRQALTICADCQDQVGITMALLVMVSLANLDSYFERAALLLGATETILDANPVVRSWPQDRRAYDAALTMLRAKLDANVLDLLFAKGRALSLEQTVSLALANQE